MARLLSPVPRNTHRRPHLNRDSNSFDFLLAAHIRMSHMSSWALRGSVSLTLRPTGPACGPWRREASRGLCIIHVEGEGCQLLREVVR